MKAPNVVRFPFSDDDRSPKVEPFRPFYVSQLEGYTPTPREWLIDGVLLARTVCLFAGAPKIGKSLLGQQMLTALAAGQPWLGRTTVQCRSFGMFTEDPQEEMSRRQIDINAHYGRSAADFELEMSWDAREAKDALLVDIERYSNKPLFTPLWYQLWNYVREEGVRIVVLDPAGVVYGGNENFRSEVTVFMRCLVAKAVEINGCIVLMVHPSKAHANGYSGSTAWLGSSRFAMALSRPLGYDEITGEPHELRDHRILRGLGANYTAGLKPERLQYQNGVFEIAEDEEKPGRRQRTLTHQDRLDLRYRLLAGMKRVILNGGRIPADEMHRESMPNRCRRSPETLLNTVAFNDLYIEQQAMIDAGQLVRVEAHRMCCLRPVDGPYYRGESIWLATAEPKSAPLAL